MSGQKKSQSVMNCKYRVKINQMVSFMVYFLFSILERRFFLISSLRFKIILV